MYDYTIRGGLAGWAKRVYGIPPERVIGSSIKARLEMEGGKTVLVRLPEVFFIEDKQDKVVDIQKFIGRRPIAAFGNSDSDMLMPRWALAGSGERRAMIVHHTDAEREYAYDRKSAVGKLVEALVTTARQGWRVISMKDDWTVIFTNR